MVTEAPEKLPKGFEQIEAFAEQSRKQRHRGQRPSQITTFLRDARPATTPWEWPGSARLSHAGRVCQFIERHVVISHGDDRRKPMRLRAWQKRAIHQLYGPDKRANRAAMFSISRGNGKTGLGAALLVAELFLVEGAQVLCLGTTERTAGLAYYRAMNAIKLSPTLADHALIYADRAKPLMQLPYRGAEMFPLPANLEALVGFAPTFALVDETGFIEYDTWMAMQTSGGKHRRSLVLGIGTPGYDKAGIMYKLRELALAPSPPPGFAFVEHAAPLAWDPGKKTTWKRANPAMGDFLKPDAIATDYATMGLQSFRTFRLGQWADREAAWMPADTWDALDVVEGPIPDGTPITLGFDGSVAIDSTGLVAYDVATSRLVVLNVWERPRGDRRWKVPRQDVRAAIEHAFSTWRVLNLYADPHYFRDMLEELGEQYPGRITEWATNARVRMAAATDRFATGAYNREFAWDGTEAFRRHVLAANAEVTPAGDVIRKRADRPQPIDLAVCAILAYEAAATIEPEPRITIY